MINLDPAVWFLFVLFLFPFFPPTSHTFQLYVEECIFPRHASVAPDRLWLHESAACTAGCRGPCLAWMPVNNIVRREEIKNATLQWTEEWNWFGGIFLFVHAALLEVPQICRGWVWTESSVVLEITDRGRAASSVPLPPLIFHLLLGKDETELRWAFTKSKH